MRILIVDDDLFSRKIMQKLLSSYGDCDIALNGNEAIKAFSLAISEGNPYSLVCMDIMMPEMDGNEALKRIRGIENDLNVPQEKEVKVVMTTGLNSPRVIAQFHGANTSCLVKPIDPEKIDTLLSKYGFSQIVK